MRLATRLPSDCCYVNWLAGNAILPDVNTNSSHTGIQKVDRTSVPELQELVTLATALQTDMDNAEGGISPLGLPQDAVAFDINPAVVVGADNGTHFEQVYQRAKVALNNAVAAFDDAKGVTALMRSEEDSLTTLRNSVAAQEQAFNNALIDICGTPYPDDMGAGKTCDQDYAGPDPIHYSYVELPESTFNGLLTPKLPKTNRIDLQQYPNDWATKLYDNMDWVVAITNVTTYAKRTNSIQFVFGPHGFFDKPAGWSGKRAGPGKLQQRISEFIASHDRVAQALNDAEKAKEDLDKQIAAFNANVETVDDNSVLKAGLLKKEEANQWIQFASATLSKRLQSLKGFLNGLTDATASGIPEMSIFGVATGTDAFGKAGQSVLKSQAIVKSLVYDSWDGAQSTVAAALAASTASARRWTENTIGNNQWDATLRDNVLSVAAGLETVQGNLAAINARLCEFDDAQRAYQAAVAEGDRVLAERTTYRAHVAQAIQGYRTRDAGFRIFRDEKLERYKTLFDLAARYSLLAANAYDYETGLLNTDAGQAFVARIINSLALGVVRNGEPQYAGSNTGDPGLSSALAEMQADWDVLRGRLGFNNPDAYGTTASLRTEALRILPGTDGDSMWKDTLQAARVSDILADSDLRRYCMQVDVGSGLAVPGIILTFNTTIARGCNLFGQPLASGDHYYSDSSFATKIFGVGVAFVGYKGMDNPSTTGTSPSDPGYSLLSDPKECLDRFVQTVNDVKLHFVTYSYSGD